MQLLIMAAGMGGRFGGLKQIEPIGPSKEFLLDYSIYDAIKVGFTKVIFIIKEENYELFRETIGKRIEGQIEVDYVFQSLNDVPDFVSIPKSRVKPLGTGHAVYSARHKITEPFLVLNADDFYGRDAFLVAKNFLENASEYDYATITYDIINTMTEHGSVTRGVVKTKNNQLDSITECLVERQADGQITATPLTGGETFTITPDTQVSVNIMAFHPSIFKYIEDKINAFFQANLDNLSTCEFFLPAILSDVNKEKYATVSAIKTTANWYGITYVEDKEKVKNKIKEMVDDGIYPENLWS